MDNLTDNLKKLEFISEEYDVISDIPVGKFLEQIPEKDEARNIFVGNVSGKTINIPTFNTVGLGVLTEFEKQIDLADFIRSSGMPIDNIKDMPIGEFLRMVSPEGSTLI